jgi:hypothetical protein
MDYRGQAKAAMNAKINRLTDEKYVKTDASDWAPTEMLDADVKTGMRPISRRAYKKGGRVDTKADGAKAMPRADRPARKDGGVAIADAIVNRDLKAANEQREGKKHIGALKRGGRAGKGGGGFMDGVKDAATVVSPAMAVGRLISGKKGGGKVEKEPDGDEGSHRDVGEALGHAMAAYHRSQSRHARASGGRIAKSFGGGFGEDMGMGKKERPRSKGGPVINITINSAPKPGMPPVLGAPPMPPPDLGGVAPVIGAPPPGGGLGAAGGPPPGAGMAPPMPQGMGPMPGQPKPFRDGGRIDAGAGGAQGRLEKIDWYGAGTRPGKATGGMTAGAGTGEGRLEKIAAYGKKA